MRSILRSLACVPATAIGILSRSRLMFGSLALLATCALQFAPVSAGAAAKPVNTDLIIFGNAKSEADHRLHARFGPVMAKVAPIPSASSATPASDVVAGALGQTARRLLPRTPVGDYYGGEMTFTMKVDPLKENNFTLKYWGSDVASESWLVLNVEGFEVGARHHMKDESMLQNSSGWMPERFIYRTVRVPQQVTRNKTQVTVKIRSLGRIFYYAPTYDQYQKRMSAPTVAMYRAYMHTGSQPAIDGEVQGQAPALALGSTTQTDEAAWLAAWKNEVSKLLRNRLATPPARLTADDMDFLAQSYSVAWTPAYANSAVPKVLIDAFDSMVASYSAMPDTYFRQVFPDHGNNAGWGGYFGQAGRAITLMWPHLQGSLDQRLDYGGRLGIIPRRAAWAAALRASVDHGRTHRRTIGNQVTDSAQRIYWANAALLLVDPSQALYETEARRYLHEAFGLAPWMGEDVLAAGPVARRGPAPYGPDWYMLTSEGTTKEDCLVGGDYGEMGVYAFTLGRQINDTALMQQGLKMLRARAALRHPTDDGTGKLTMRVANAIGCRNDHQMDRHRLYLATGADAMLVAGAGLNVIGSELLGYAQQQFDEGQLLPQMPVGGGNWMKGYAGWNMIAAVPDAYLAFRAQPVTGVKLPMSSGQVDFAWGDEENMTVAAKRGEERFYANLYWRGPQAINRLARVFVVTPRMANLADVSIDHVRFNPANKTIRLKKDVDGTPIKGGMTPPDDPISANLGLELPQALRPDLKTPPPINRDAGRGTGYTLQYGNWLVAINAHHREPYDVKLPADFGSGLDLVSGSWKNGRLVLQPKTTAVFYLPDVKPPVVNQPYRLTARHSGLSLTTSRDNAGDRSSLRQKPWQAEASQTWTMERLANGDYRLRVKASGLVLEARNRPNLGKDNVVYVRADRNDNLQRWRVTALGGGGYSICAKLEPRSCLTVQGASSSRDAAVVLSDFRGAAHQQWTAVAP